MLDSTVVSPVSPTRLGFCQRCGDPISGKVRCSRCGGTSKEPRIRSTQALPAAKKPDPWANRYVDRAHAVQSDVETEQDEYLHNQPPPLSPKRASFDPALGFGMPSRISRDLRTSTSVKSEFAASGATEPSFATSPNHLSVSSLGPAPRDSEPRRVSQHYSAPVVKGSDGVLSKVCGSLVEPSQSRNRWACADCASVFARDSTLYAAPASLHTHDASYYCRDCYAKRYSLGICRACRRDVLGSTKQDGKYVKASAGVWHGSCWKCTACSKPCSDATDIFLGMHGNPTCEHCFHLPTRASAPTSPVAANSRDVLGLPDVRRLTRIAATRNGPMGATIAELTTKLGQQTVATRSTSNTALSNSSSSRSSFEASRSSGKRQYAFPNHIPHSSGKTVSMARSGSLTGSPPKPRPLTAQFRDGMNLAAFKPSYAGDVEHERLHRTDSRSRSVSPVKTPEPQLHTSPANRVSPFDPSPSVTSKAVSSSSNRETEAASSRVSSKVPGSPSLAPVGSAAGRPDLSLNNATPTQEAARCRTSSGFPRPLNSPFSKRTDATEPIQGEKATASLERDASDSSLPSRLEPPEGTVRCAACHYLPFERANSTTDEVVMVTLADHVHLHAECFRCCICRETIDGAKTFVRLPADAAYVGLAEGLAAYAHPHCAPTIQLTVVRSTETHRQVSGGERSFRTSLDPNSVARSHATHQRQLKPSPTPSPSTSMRDGTVGMQPWMLEEKSPSSGTEEHQSMHSLRNRCMSSTAGETAPGGVSGNTSMVRRFQPTAGAAPPTRSTILTSPGLGKTVNPAAGMFSRMSALSIASGNASLTSPTAPVARRRFGGMQCCAFCGEKLSSLESVLGPRGTQWHKACLICRAPPPPPPKDAWSYRKQPPTICAKKLDSGAKVNHNGEVRCRDCYDRESAAFRIKS